MNWEYLIGSTIMGLIFLVGGIIWKKYPPKKINHLYGYRTRRSMANQIIWDYANKIGAKMFIYTGAFLLGIGLVAYFLFPVESTIIVLFAMLIGVVVGMFWCEAQLNKRFDKNGNSKKTPQF